MDTKCIKWSPETGFDKKDLAQAAAVIAAGGLVAFPTETVYGLGGDGLRREAAKKIYEAKGRPSDNPLILHIAGWEQLGSIAERIPLVAEKLARNFWPGPLTMIFRKKDGVPDETTGGLDTVAVRMPDHPGALAFLAAAGVPVAAPSANTSGRPSPTLAAHVKEDMDGKIDMIIDGGEVGIGYESTIVDVTGKTPVILRPGFITCEMIREVVGSVETDPAILQYGQVEEDVAPRAPGMKYRHYAPRAKMTVYRGAQPAAAEKIRQQILQYISAGDYREDEIGILTTEESLWQYPRGQALAAGSRSRDTEGKYLYKVLRQFDELGVRVILSEGFDDSPKCEAVMNRLLKAAGQHVVEVD